MLKLDSFEKWWSLKILAMFSSWILLEQLDKSSRWLQIFFNKSQLKSLFISPQRERLCRLGRLSNSKLQKFKYKHNDSTLGKLSNRFEQISESVGLLMNKVRSRNAIKFLNEIYSTDFELKYRHSSEESPSNLISFNSYPSNLKSINYKKRQLKARYRRFKI